VVLGALALYIALGMLLNGAGRRVLFPMGGPPFGANQVGPSALAVTAGTGSDGLWARGYA